jgi:hypothetical protein
MINVRHVILSVKWVPSKLTTYHLPAIAILVPTSNTAIMYQAIYACSEASVENAKERPRYTTTARPSDMRTAIRGSRVVRYFQEKNNVEVYCKNSTPRLAINIKESVCRVLHSVSLGSNCGPIMASPTMTPKWQI